MSIYISAIIKSKAGHSADLKPFLLELVNEARSEKACLRYDLHQSIEDENVFLINEEWSEQYWLDLHIQRDYISRFKSASDPLIDEQIIVHKTEKIA